MKFDTGLINKLVVTSIFCHQFFQKSESFWYVVRNVVSSYWFCLIGVAEMKTFRDDIPVMGWLTKKKLVMCSGSSYDVLNKPRKYNWAEFGAAKSYNISR